ncbi:hypothetical protein [Streptosporangium sp. NPDC004631]
MPAKHADRLPGRDVPPDEVEPLPRGSPETRSTASRRPPTAGTRAVTVAVRRLTDLGAAWLDATAPDARR